MRRRWRRRRGFRKRRGFRGNLCSWIGYTLARRWRARSSLRFSPLRLVAPVVVGPELILSFNGTYRAPRSLLPATSYPRFSGRERHQTGVPATRLDSIIGTELRDTLRPIARLLGSHPPTTESAVKSEGSLSFGRVNRAWIPQSRVYLIPYATLPTIEPSHERVPEQTELAGFTTWFVATRMSFPDPSSCDLWLSFHMAIVFFALHHVKHVALTRATLR